LPRLAFALDFFPPDVAVATSTGTGTGAEAAAFDVWALVRGRLPLLSFTSEWCVKRNSYTAEQKNLLDIPGNESSG